jgi:hypothetical protein
LHPDVYALGIEIVDAKRELADPESRLAWLVYLLFGMWMHMPDEVAEALDKLRGHVLGQRGHDRIAVVPASELHSLTESDPTPIALQPNGDPDFSYRPRFKSHIDTSEFFFAPAPLIDLAPVDVEGDPLITEEELRLVFHAHGVAYTERTLLEMQRRFRELRAEWSQTAQDREDTFLREMRETAIGEPGGISYRDAERLARERGLDISQSTIRRRLGRL